MSRVARPLPYVGAVIRYGYLWRDEALRRRDGGRKDRPCLILAAAAVDEGIRVYVAPITRTEHDAASAFELKRHVQRRAGLDTGRPSWLITREVNHFLWRGADVVPVREGREYYGRLDDPIVTACQERFLSGIQISTVTATDRDESNEPASKP